MPFRWYTEQPYSREMCSGHHPVLNRDATPHPSCVSSVHMAMGTGQKHYLEGKIDNPAKKSKLREKFNALLDFVMEKQN